MSDNQQKKIAGYQVPVQVFDNMVELITSLPYRQVGDLVRAIEATVKPMYLAPDPVPGELKGDGAIVDDTDKPEKPANH